MTQIELYPHKKWKLKSLILCHLVAAFLILTFLLPSTAEIWKSIDIGVFKWLNNSLDGRSLWQVFWAMANHKYADWVEDLVIIAFFTTYIRSAVKIFRVRRIAEFLFCILFTALVIYGVNQVIFKECFIVHRESPTLVVDQCIRLSEQVPRMKVKDDASKSFPGDHGTTALIFAGSLFYFAGRRLGIWGCLYAVFLCLPRLITGAHWFSDIVVGSGCIALLTLSWALCTPFHTWCISRLESLFPKPALLSKDARASSFGKK